MNETSQHDHLEVLESLRYRLAVRLKGVHEAISAEAGRQALSKREESGSIGGGLGFGSGALVAVSSALVSDAALMSALSPRRRDSTISSSPTTTAVVPAGAVVPAAAASAGPDMRGALAVTSPQGSLSSALAYSAQAKWATLTEEEVKLLKTQRDEFSHTLKVLEAAIGELRGAYSDQLSVLCLLAA